MSEADIIIEQGTRLSSKPRWHVLVGDFANMLKAFIGSNYLTIAYAFKQSGLVLGLVGLFIIAIMTDHCCHLIVKCKYYAIERLLGKRNSRGFTPVKEEDDEDSESNDSDDEDDSVVSKAYQKMQRSFTYGDVGKVALGGPGLFIVNFCLVFTQFGFCVAYFIFVGNTIHSIFPFTNPNTTYEIFTLHNATSSSVNSSSLPYEEIGNGTFESEDIWGNHSSVHMNGTTNRTSNATGWSPFHELEATLPVLNLEADEDSPWFNLTTASVSTGPDLRLLVLSPLPIFIAFAFLRDVRHLGVVSVGANVAIFFGSVVTLAYMFVGFDASDTWEEYEWKRLPIFFGMVTSAFEGIGTIIPIESSMEGNRHNYSKFLHGAIFILGALLTVFGVVGYLRFGDQTAQMLNGNIPAHSFTGLTLNILLCVGVILTFPLQIYPVIEVVEIYTFGYGRIFGPKRSLNEDKAESISSSESDESALLPKEKNESISAPVAVTVPPQVPAWKRNILRILLLLTAGGLAVLLRDFFAYVGALIGAIGSSLLAYILPCIFHQRLRWHETGLLVRIKDILIIVFGILASIVSLYITLSEIAAKF